MGAEPDEVLRLAIDLVRLGAALGTGLAERSGLHSSDVRALQVLDAAAGGSGTTMGELAHDLGLSPPAVTALVSRLEAKDLARRETHPDDRRRIRVVLGQAARAFGAEHLAPLSARLRAAVEELTAEERVVVARFLRSATMPR